MTDQTTATPDAWGFSTAQVHAGVAVGQHAFGATALPIFQTTSYDFPSAQVAADRFALKDLDPLYTRIGNPTQGPVEEKIAALEGGVGALLLASGQAATTFAILNLAGAGDHVVASASLYGGTQNLFKHTLAKVGVETTFVTDPDDLVLRRDPRQPARGRPGRARRRRRRPRGRRAADRGQHAGHPVPAAAHRARRRRRHPLRHEVPRRARRGRHA